MNEYLKTSLPAIIAGLVALIVAIFGYWRWTRESRKARLDEYARERREAYKTLWNTLESFHENFRAGLLTGTDLADETLKMNMEIFRLAPYLDDDIHGLANTYVRHIQELSDSVYALGRENDRIQFAISVNFSEDADSGLLRFETRWHATRRAMRDRVAAVLKGEDL